MAALINEQQSFQDIDGKPIVNGFIYVGLQNADTKTNLISIFSDRELTVFLENPQRTDAFGKSATKIWVPGRHSLLIEDENNVQKLSDPDAGELAGVGLTSLTNVQGTNAITAQGTPAITSYIDKNLYIFTTVAQNTSSVTLDIDSNGIVPIRKEHDLELVAKNFEAEQIVLVAYNEPSNVFELISQITNDEQLIIKIWSGTIASIPAGFQICDGTNGTPDLRNSFVIGAGDTHTPGDTGGGTVTGGHSLTVAELAAHDHSYTHVVSQSQNANLNNDVQATAQIAGAITGSTGSGTAHTHPQVLPPFFALAYIMKL